MENRENNQGAAEAPANAAAALDVPIQPEGWERITNTFLFSVKHLNLGDLVHDEKFNLLDAMSAIEMMEPKMDAGLLCDRSERPKTFEQAVEDGTIKLDTLTPEELIAIMDTTLSCFVSWIEGNSLAQTVFTNLYLHKPYDIQDRTLKVFSLVTYKLLDVIKEFVQKAQTFEEEDFQPKQYGYHLNPDISNQKIIAMLKDVEEFHKRLSDRASLSGPVDEPVEPLALYARIKFIRIFYQLLTIMLQRKKDQTRTSAECQRLIVIAMDMLFIMQRTVHLGTPPAGAWYEQIMGFEPLINQKLLPPTLPRYTKVRPRDEALSYIENTLEKLKPVCKIYSVISFHSALDFLEDFSRNNPCLLSRSILQYLYVGNYCLNPGPSSNSFKEILREAVRFFVPIPSDVTRAIMSNQQGRAILDTFLSLCVKPFTHLLQVSGHNRARQREKLMLVLEDFTKLQFEAERVDLFIYNLASTSWYEKNVACYGSWLLYHTLRTMIMFILSGFELELYSDHEYTYIYWYLYEYLYGWLVSTLTRADNFFLEQEAQDLKRIKGKKTKAKIKKKARPFNREILFGQALQSMCGGVYKALAALRIDKKLKLPDTEFDKEVIHYNHRFAPFKCLITPPLIEYDEFREMIEANSKNPICCMRLYISASKHFLHARKLLESMEPTTAEIADLIVVCKTNYVVLKLTATGHNRDTPNPPEYDFSKSKYFPIIKVT